MNKTIGLSVVGLGLVLTACGASDPGGLEFEPIELDGAPDFVTDFVFEPGSSRFFATTKAGRVVHYELNGDDTEQLGSFEIPDVHEPLDCGLVSIALDPDFADNRMLYVGKCVSGKASGIYRYTFNEQYEGIADSEAEIMSAGHSDAEFAWHNVGSISFDDRGYLWALFGEKTVPDEAQNLDSPLGALVRIEPNRDDDGDGFEPAPGNPLAGRGEAGAAIYAYGLRSPWRGALDREGRYWIGDVGELAVEELNVAVEGGENFGWPYTEGPCERDCAGLTDAVTTWDHSGADPYTLQDGLANLTVGEPPVALASRVVWVGTAYNDPDHDRYAGLLTGRTVFGDYCAGFVRVAELDDDGTLGVDQPVGHLTTPVAWRQGPDDYIYAISGAACQTDRANPADAPSRLYRAVLADS